MTETVGCENCMCWIDLEGIEHWIFCDSCTIKLKEAGT